MNNPHKRNAKLVLSNGITFTGFSFGASGTTIGEIVFNTGMTGYQEVITDPSYFGQILTFTYPEIGNTGINYEDSESNITVNGIIVRNYSSNNSNWRSEKSFNQWLIEQNIIGLYGIDTRALVKILRSNGSMNGLITSEDKDIKSCLRLISDKPKMEGLNLSKEVSTKNNYSWQTTTKTDFDIRKKNANHLNKLKIIAIDFGIKQSILNRLVSHGCEILVLPYTVSFEDILAKNPDGIFFTTGIPTILGMSVFVVSYIIVTRNIAEIPPSATIAISALFFLLGLAGLSFGILSASWDKDPGSFFGIENIPLNIKRAKAAFKPASQNFEEKN